MTTSDRKRARGTVFYVHDGAGLAAELAGDGEQIPEHLVMYRDLPHLRFGQLLLQLQDEAQSARGWQARTAALLNMNPAHLSRVFWGKQSLSQLRLLEVARALGIRETYFSTSSTETSSLQIDHPELGRITVLSPKELDYHDFLINPVSIELPLKRILTRTGQDRSFVSWSELHDEAVHLERDFRGKPDISRDEVRKRYVDFAQKIVFNDPVQMAIAAIVHDTDDSASYFDLERIVFALSWFINVSSDLALRDHSLIASNPEWAKNRQRGFGQAALIETEPK